MEEAVENMRPQFNALLASATKTARTLTQQGMADKLNADGCSLLTGQPWTNTRFAAF